MSRIEMPPELSVWVAERIAAFPAEIAEGQRWLVPEVAEYRALPLYLGWDDVTAIRPGGELVRWGTEDGPSGEIGIRPIEDRREQLITLVLGCKRYEQIRVLLPPRPEEAEDCSHLGIELFGASEGKVICPQCCGLGWVLPGDRLPAIRHRPTLPERARGLMRRLFGG